MFDTQKNTTPSKRTADFIALEEAYGAHNYHPLDVVLARGEGPWMWDVDGKKYFDCLSAYSALNQGHCHPRIVRALVEQAHRVTLTSRAFRNEEFPHLLKEACTLLGFEMMLPMNSGAEAVETALKATRLWGYKVKGIPDGKAEIIACTNNFHGRTITVVSFSTEPLYRDGFGPFTPGFRLIPFGDAAALSAAITSNTAGFLFEPIQAEAGILLPPDGYLRAVREICTQHNVLCVADEIQTGLGRTGKLLAMDWEDVKPDLVTLGKALSGGMMPVSAVLGRRDVLGLFSAGSHGSTFGGNPLGCAVAREALRVIVEEGLVEKARVNGSAFRAKLAAIDSPYVKEVRGKGLLVGVEIKKECGPARPFCERLKERGLLAKETHDQVIRLAPPLVATADELDWAVARTEEVLMAAVPVG